ncbi:hypothetical protein ACWEQL_21205 [Kitasatospora sp. NPDC004240]
MDAAVPPVTKLDDLSDRLDPLNFRSGKAPERSTISERLAGKNLDREFAEAVISAFCRQDIEAQRRFARELTTRCAAHKGSPTLQDQMKLMREIAKLNQGLMDALRAHTKATAERDACKMLSWILLSTVDGLQREANDLTLELDKLRQPGLSDFADLAQMDRLRRQLSTAQRCIAEADEELTKLQQAQDRAAETIGIASRLVEEGNERLRDMGQEPAIETPFASGVFEEPDGQPSMPLLDIPEDTDGRIIHAEHTVEQAREIREDIEQSLERSKELVLRSASYLVPRPAEPLALPQDSGEPEAEPEPPMTHPSATFDVSPTGDPAVIDVSLGEFVREAWKRPAIRNTVYLGLAAILLYRMSTPRMCPSCANTRSVTCPSCTAGRTEAAILCPMRCTAPTAGQPACPVCNGDGEVVILLACQYCASTGRVPCQACKDNR